jgi:predicted 2-oxoglutarate/Fe(II)-dependent dioxygenase YbiX
MAARNTWRVPLDSGMDELNHRIATARADVAAHFNLPLRDHEGASVLMYQPGGFYEPHVDAGADEPQTATTARLVSVVIFLNAMNGGVAPDGYAGGALTFYGLIDDPAWRGFGFALEPEAGLLVAFPSHLVHEVTPVTGGDRYTIVDWFTA